MIDKIKKIHPKRLPAINLMTLFGLDKIQKQLIFAVSIAAVLVLNLVVSSLSFRLDLSRGQAYTLSQSTKNILRDLEDVINIQFYISSDLPPELQPLRTDVTDLLNEYDGITDRVRVSTIDPSRSQEAQTEANQAGIQEIQFSRLDRDEFAVQTGYFGIVVRYGEQSEVISQATEIGSLEYDLTSAIYKMTRDEDIDVAILGREDIGLPQNLGIQPNQQTGDQLQLLKQELGKQYSIQNLNVSTSSATQRIEERFKTILVFDDNQKEYDEQEVQAIKDYINNNGNAVFFVDGVWVNELQGLVTSDPASNLNELLADFGVTVENNLILSEAAELVNVGSPQGFQVISAYPFWMRTNNLNPEVPYFSNITQLVYPWTSSLSLEDKNGYSSTVLVESAGRSWEQRDNFILFPDSIPQPDSEDFQEFTLASLTQSENGGSLVVIPTSRFVLDQFAQRSPGNLNFVLNVVNDFASEGILSGIRQRAVNFYPLPNLPQTQQDIFKYANILFLPAVFGIFGAVRLMRRK